MTYFFSNMVLVLVRKKSSDPSFFVLASSEESWFLCFRLQQYIDVPIRPLKKFYWKHISQYTAVTDTCARFPYKPQHCDRSQKGVFYVFGYLEISLYSYFNPLRSTSFSQIAFLSQQKSYIQKTTTSFLDILFSTPPRKKQYTSRPNVTRPNVGVTNGPVGSTNQRPKAAAWDGSSLGS